MHSGASPSRRIHWGSRWLRSRGETSRSCGRGSPERTHSLAFAPIHFLPLRSVMLVHRRFLVALLVAGAACAQKTASTSTVAPQGSSRPRKNSDVITQEELRD